MEFIVIGFIVACVVWFVWRARARNRASKKAVLDQAWHVVLDDPDYTHRRRYEERMREYDERAHKESERP